MHAPGGQATNLQSEHDAEHPCVKVTVAPEGAVTVTQLNEHCEPTQKSELLPFAALMWNVTFPVH
jgi:hypothetical protein